MKIIRIIFGVILDMIGLFFLFVAIVGLLVSGSIAIGIVFLILALAVIGVSVLLFTWKAITNKAHPAFIQKYTSPSPHYNSSPLLSSQTTPGHSQRNLFDDNFSSASKIIDMALSQQEKAFQTVRTNPASQTLRTDELRDLNSLLYEGVITQEEFDAKKKQLLGL